jgi:glycosyltransferase involved in cell wall biosynthesis
MNNDFPQILYVTSCWPHDKNHGGQLRALQMGRVSLAVIGAHDVETRIKTKTAEEFELKQELKVTPCSARNIFERTASIFDPHFINIHGVAADTKDEAKLIDSQGNYDLTWFFKLRTANYFTKSRWQKAVVDVDDLPSTMEKSSSNGGSPYLRLKSQVRTFALRQHENRLDRRFDVLGVCSEDDRNRLGGGANIHVIPNGIARPGILPPRNPSLPPRIGFIGLYTYEPNLKGVHWFVQNCWERIKSEVPGVRLRLVGEATDGPLKPKDSSIDGLGWVEQPLDEIASWSTMIVPIHFGAGTRVKVADAFSRKCPLVSTRFGALGYEVQNGQELLMADSPHDFAAACISLIKDPLSASAMAERGYNRFLEKWTWEAISPRVWEAAEDCLRLNLGRFKR